MQLLFALKTFIILLIVFLQQCIQLFYFLPTLLLYYIIYITIIELQLQLNLMLSFQEKLKMFQKKSEVKDPPPPPKKIQIKVDQKSEKVGQKPENINISETAQNAKQQIKKEDIPTGSQGSQNKNIAVNVQSKNTIQKVQLKSKTSSQNVQKIDVQKNTKSQPPQNIKKDEKISSVKQQSINKEISNAPKANIKIQPKVEPIKVQPPKEQKKAPIINVQQKKQTVKPSEKMEENKPIMKQTVPQKVPIITAKQQKKQQNDPVKLTKASSNQVSTQNKDTVTATEKNNVSNTVINKPTIQSKPQIISQTKPVTNKLADKLKLFEKKPVENEKKNLPEPPKVKLNTDFLQGINKPVENEKKNLPEPPKVKLNTDFLQGINKPVEKNPPVNTTVNPINANFKNLLNNVMLMSKAPQKKKEERSSLPEKQQVDPNKVQEIDILIQRPKGGKKNPRKTMELFDNLQ